jgi:hypothetical protein
MNTQNRWLIGLAGVFMQPALGAAHAWSVFGKPLSKQFGWSCRPWSGHPRLAMTERMTFATRQVRFLHNGADQ